MNLPPNSWGPFFWHTMHIVALGYPTNPTYINKKAAKEFYESLRFILPCSVCKEHYSTFINEMPVTPFLDTRQDLFKWTVMLHNKVNQSLGKPRVTEMEAIEYYKRLGNTSRSPVYTSADYADADLRAMIKGIGLGVAVTVTLGTILWYLRKED